MTTTFSDLGLHENIVSAITELGFESPTLIQEKAIPVFLERKSDLIALAQTGTGKTASFGLPIIHNLDLNEKFTQALVISPTRELCMQITNDLKNYSKHMKGVKIVAVYGGSSITNQIKDLRAGAHIIVATPGRLMDMIDRKAVKLEQIQTVVLDEADEMLNMGFQEDIESILSNTPEEKITGLFSATMPREIRNIANKYLKETVEVSSGKKNSTSADITHQYAVVAARDKMQSLKRIIDFNEDFFGIIFCTTRLETQDISDSLVKAGYNADCLHGDLSQQQRDKVMGKFRKRTIKILCATDVAARGIDVNDITHVIHYHLPDDIENYTHRSGRTARAGKKGISIALLHVKEAYKMHQIEKIAQMKFEKFLIPRGEEIISKRLNNFIQDFTTFDTNEATDLNIKDEWSAPLLEMSKEDLVARILVKELAKLDTGDSNHNDLNVDETSRGGRSNERGGDRNGNRRDGGEGSGRSRRDRVDGDGTRLFINLGKKDNLRYDAMRELIFQNSKVSGHNIKDIDMQGVFSFFETDSQSADRIIAGFDNVEYNGRQVRIERTEANGGSRAGAPRRSFGGGDRNGGGNSDRKRSYGGGSSDRKSFGGNSDRAERNSSFERGSGGERKSGYAGRVASDSKPKFKKKSW
jgi:ATP-dependent RNA helicase DeaD